MTTPPQDLTSLLRLSLHLCQCGHLKGVHAADGAGKCHTPTCECEEFRKRIELVTAA